MSTDYPEDVERELARTMHHGREDGLKQGSVYVMDLAQKAWTRRKEEAEMLRSVAEDLEALAVEAGKEADKFREATP